MGIFFYLVYKMVKLFQTIRKTVSEFDASMFVVFEEMRKTEFIGRSLTLQLLISA